MVTESAEATGSDTGSLAAPPPRGVVQVLGLWVIGRCALMFFVVLASYVLAIDDHTFGRSRADWLIGRFVWWDSLHFLRIVDRGYLPPGLPCCDQAFFPGYPLAVRVVEPIFGQQSAVTALVISAVAASIAAVLLWQLGSLLTRNPQVGWNAVSYLAVAPFGIFLSAAYSESLFIALLLGAWLAGLRRHWWAAGALAGLSTAVRVNGVFLAAGLFVMYVMQLHADGRRLPRRDVLALLCPAVPILAYLTYLHSRTGSWNGWLDAESIGWQRQTVWPWQAFRSAWTTIVHAASPDLVFTRWADLLTMFGGLLVLAVLLRLRRWPEATFMALNLAVLIITTNWISLPRYALTWFPAFLLVAEVTVRPRWRWLHGAIIAVSVPLLAVVSLTFSAHLWVA